MKLSIACALSAIIFITACSENSDIKTAIIYPDTRKVDQVDDYFGVKINDPYRWLENDTSAETESWVKTENELTFAYLSQIPYRDQIRARLDELLNYPRMSSPIKAGEYYLYYKNTGLQNQDVIFKKKGLEGEESVFIDPNKYSADGTTSIHLSGISRDDRFAVISISEAGSDWHKMIVLDIETAESTGDTLSWIKFSGSDWDDGGFYYSRYPEPKDGAEYSASNALHSVYYHKLGDSQEQDQLIFQDPEHPGRYHWTNITEDGKFLVLYIAEGTDGFECHYKSTATEKTVPFTPLFTGFEHKSTVIDHENGRFLIRTDVDAPNYKLVSIDLANPAPDSWTDVIPEGENLLEDVVTAGGYLFANYLEKACNQAYQCSYDGEIIRKIELPASGSVHGFSGKKEAEFVFYNFSSFVYPGNIFKYELATGKTEVYYKPSLSFNPEDYVSKQVFYPSKDGTQISMFIVHHKDVEYDGSNPCFLHGYGGFNISQTPGFSTVRIPWLENSGVFALANLRGGGEYGESWHQAGMLSKKQNVFDDFISAAEYLIKEGYTSSEKLVISGRSNGGLLVGAVMTQRPDLMKVALPGVGVLDMLRYHKFTVGHGWIPEYGSSDNKEDFVNLLAYSPLHNVKEGVTYPATMLYTGDHDDRVVPAHSFKFAATLQEKQMGSNPVLIRIETDGGHGGGKPISKQLDEEADKLTFSFYNIGVTPYKKPN